MIKLVSDKSKTNLLVKTVIRWGILKLRRFPRNSCSKKFAKFRINVSSGVYLQKSFKSQVFNFTKDRIRLVVPLGILKIFRAAILLTPAANYFYYYVISWSFLLIERVSSLYLFQWRHCRMTSDRLRNSI